MTNIEIVTKMVENGYHLFNETIEHFASRFSNEMLMMFMESFLNSK